jgi:hypothetical protein
VLAVGVTFWFEIVCEEQEQDLCENQFSHLWQAEGIEIDPLLKNNWKT